MVKRNRSRNGSTPEDPHHLRRKGLEHFGHCHGCPHDHQLEVVVGWVAILAMFCDWTALKSTIKKDLQGLVTVDGSSYLFKYPPGSLTYK